MIKKLRWKVIFTNMLFVAMVLLSVFAGVFLSSRASIIQRSNEQLQQALRFDTTGLPCFVAEVLPSGTVRLSGSSYYELMDDQTLLAAVQGALESEADTGVLRTLHLRFCRQQGLLTTRIAFMDSSFEQTTLRSLVVTSLLIGAAALGVLFACSYFLSGYVTGPVARAWQAQRRFLSDASHELKTPLTVILSSGELLRQTLPPEQQSYAENICEESRRMKRLVEDMLTLSRTEDGAAIPMAELDFSDLVTDCALRFEPVSFEACRVLQYDIVNGLRVWGNSEKLTQLTGILLDNAIKYAPKGTPVKLTLQRSGKEAVLAVQNGGTPIPAEKLPHIFERFYRVDEARSGSEGFGLGLAIAKDIAGAHRGAITCRSDAAATVFAVTLPLK